jgi:putative hemolysin
MVIDVLGRVPGDGDRFEREGHSFEVADMDGRRVDRVLVSPSTCKNVPTKHFGE